MGKMLLTKPVVDAGEPDVFADGCVTVEKLEAEFSIKRSAAYDLMQRGRLPWSRVNGRRLIPRAAVRKLLLEGLVGAEAKPEPAAV